jgi:putative methyltransferase (TIGR04325 family)
MIAASVRIVSSVLRDLYGYWSFDQPAGVHRCRGVYPTYAAAAAAMPSRELHGFNHASVPEFFIDTHFVFNPSDYPNLFWLLNILKPGEMLFDLGGGVGQCFYLYQRLLPLPEQTRWVVCEIPSFIEPGRQLAKERQAANLEFTTEFQAAKGAGVVLCNGALQYLETDLSQMLAGLERLPRHVLINRVPLYDGEAYYTVQKSLHSCAPYKVMNLAAFIRGMEELGYENVDKWYLPRWLSIPFHPRNFVSHYWGFYFRLRGELPQAV